MPWSPVRAEGAHEIQPETLTRREREILALLAEGLTGPEIAARLTVALSSVKSHLQHLYSKLGVNSKRQAVARARELGWLPMPAAVAAVPVSPSPSPTLAPVVLPLQVTRFFGRAPEIAQVRTQLAEWRLVTLTGPGGVGKTRLAVAVAEHSLADFPDGVWFVELAPLSELARVGQVVAAAVGASDATRGILERLIQFLAPRRALVVLDNCEHLLAAIAPLAEMLLRRCPRLRLLATSRAPIQIAGEAVYSVPSLPFPDPRSLPPLAKLDDYAALSLFVERTRAVVPGYAVTQVNAVWLAQICQRLDGIPLALELAAARMRLLDAETLAARLDDTFQVLTGGSPTALPRHQTLRATIDWSYQLLSRPERLLLRRLAIFAGGCTLEAAEGVCAGEGLDSGEVLERLAALVDKSMVVAETRPGETPRYRLLEMVRQYAREKLEAAGEVARLQRRHCEYFLAFTQANAVRLFKPERPVWLKRFQADYENLTLAMEQVFEASDAVEAAIRQVVALQPLWFWYDAGRWQCRNWCQKGLDRLSGGAVLAPAVHAAFLAWSSVAFWWRSESRPLAERALALSRGLGPEHNEVLCWSLWVMAMGGCHMEVWPEYRAEAEALLDEQDAVIAALRPDSKLDARLYQGYNLWLRAVLANYRDEYERARAFSEEALRLFRECGAEIHQVAPLIALGDTALRAGQYDLARSIFLQVLPMADQPDWRHVDLLVLLCETELRCGNLRGALDYTQIYVKDAGWGSFRNGWFNLLDRLEATARIMVCADQPLAAARLLGVTEAQSKAWGRPDSPRTTRECYWGNFRVRLADATLDGALPDWRSRADAVALAQAWDEGRAMPIEDAVAYAMSLKV